MLTSYDLLFVYDRWVLGRCSWALRVKEGSSSSSYKGLIYTFGTTDAPGLESMTFTTVKATEVDTSEGSPKYELVRDKLHIHLRHQRQQLRREISQNLSE